jgi:hypothetical protein
MKALWKDYSVGNTRAHHQTVVDGTKSEQREQAEKNTQ